MSLKGKVSMIDVIIKLKNLLLKRDTPAAKQAEIELFVEENKK